MTFQLAWDAFQHGSIPIGAIITDQAGNVLSTGRNHLGETLVPNPRTAHAEALCVRNLDISKYRNFNHYHLYTTMEPCPMCIGVIVMGGIRNVHVAAKDRYCGALHYLEDDPFMKGKQVSVWMDAPEMGSVQIVQQAYHEYRRSGGADTVVFQQIGLDYPREVALGKKLYKTRWLDKCAESNLPYSQIYDDILTKLALEY